MDEIKRGDRFVGDGDDTHLYVVLAADMVDMDGDRFVLFEKRHKPHPSHTCDWVGYVEAVWGCTSLDGLAREGFTPYRHDPESQFTVGDVVQFRNPEHRKGEWEVKYISEDGSTFLYEHPERGPLLGSVASYVKVD